MSDIEDSIQINKEFAAKYKLKKDTEELTRLKSAFDEASDTDDTDEDENGILLDASMDSQIVRIISNIKSKNPVVYDPDATFFDGLLKLI